MKEKFLLCSGADRGYYIGVFSTTEQSDKLSNVASCSVLSVREAYGHTCEQGRAGKIPFILPWPNLLHNTVAELMIPSGLQYPESHILLSGPDPNP